MTRAAGARAAETPLYVPQAPFLTLVGSLAGASAPAALSRRTMTRAAGARAAEPSMMDLFAGIPVPDDTEAGCEVAEHRYVYR